MKKCKTGILGKVIAWLIVAAMAFGVPGPCVSLAEDVPTQAAQGVQAAAAATAASTDEGLKAEMPKTGNVTVNFKEVDILTVLNYLSEVSGVDIIPSPGVDAKITMRLRDKPWEQALDIVTRNYGYVYSREGDVIRVIPKSQVNTEETITEVITLNNLIREIELMKTASVSTGSSSGGGEVTVKQQEQSIQQLMGAINSMLDGKRGEKATFVAGVNSIIVTAVPNKISEIRKMVQRIDKRPPQIVLDAKVVEITLRDDERFGVDWNAVITAAGARRPITFPFTNTGLLNFLPGQQANYLPSNVQNQSIANFPATGPAAFLIDTTTTNPAADSLFAYGSLDFSRFTATLSLLENRGDTEILSCPRVTTLNNQKATIKVIEKMMLQKSVATTQTATLVTVEFETEDEAREVGIKLTVIPHVNDNNEISVNLLPEVSSNAGFNTINVGLAATATVALTFLSREANTTVRANDGETIFLGGLIRKNTVKTNNKLPILGDIFGGIPWVGNAFKYEADNSTRTEIAFFVTVHLVKDGMDTINATNSMDRYNEYFTNATRVVPPAKASKGVRQMPDKNQPAFQSGTPVIENGQVTTVERTVEVPVTVTPAVQPKKQKKAFLDFSKNK